MNTLIRTAGIGALLGLGLAASVQAQDKSMIIDGIMATLTQRNGADVVMLDTEQGSSRQLREAQAVDAAADLSGCRATVVNGTEFDGQGSDARPVIIPIRLDC